MAMTEAITPTIEPGSGAPVNTPEPRSAPMRTLSQDRPPDTAIPLIPLKAPMQAEEPAIRADDTAQRSGKPINTGSTPAGNPAPNGKPRPARSSRPCPYCGHLGENDGAHEQCSRCKGWFEPLSRQASQNSMGPWFFHDDAVPFRPGCSYETLRKLIAKQRVTGDTLIRGPGSNQFWVYARHCPGVAHLLGVCHNCARPATESDFCCEHCGAAFPTFEDRQHLGLAPVRLLPGQANPSHVAASALNRGLNADPDESNYGPVAPTFAIAAAEAAAATAESGLHASVRSSSEETIDEAPIASPSMSTRRDRRYGRMKLTLGAMLFVIVVLCIAVGALLLRSTPAAVAAAAPTSNNATPAVQTPAETPTREANAWSDRLARAEALIATADPAQMDDALKILRDMQANAPESARPADLDTRIDRLAEAIDSAKLRNYLKKSS
jgi:hypothetical protein